MNWSDPVLSCNVQHQYDINTRLDKEGKKVQQRSSEINLHVYKISITEFCTLRLLFVGQ